MPSGNDADLPLNFDGMRGEIQAEKLGAAGARRQQTGEHLDGRGFAGTVWPEKAEELPCGDFKINAIDRGQIAEAARKFFASRWLRSVIASPTCTVEGSSKEDSNMSAGDASETRS